MSIIKHSLGEIMYWCIGVSYITNRPPVLSKHTVNFVYSSISFLYT